MPKEFLPYEAFEYNRARKLTFAAAVITGAVLLILFIGIYLRFWQHSQFVLLEGIRAIMGHVNSHMDLPTLQASTTLGIFYTSAFGGLFFVVTSMEGMFIALLNAGHEPILANALYISGITTSYSLNYFIGTRSTAIVQKIISPQKFFKLKGVLNKHGAIAIFGFNVTPLPSQPLSAILGAVKYTKTKFYVYTLAGQIIKFALITTALTYIL